MLKKAQWYEHPSKGQDVDVGILPIGAGAVGLAKDILGGQDPNMFIDSGQEVFLPGYPLGLSHAGKMPIWKRASVASSLEFGEGIHTKILVDTATREGMSGSPCLALSNWRHYSRDPEAATFKLKVVEMPLSWRLLGIYSGRVNAGDALGAQLGVVWRENLIADCISGKKPAAVALRQ
jgi:hypothetical protein